MNQKAYSILFCALLASTFYHEIRAKAAAHPPSAVKALGRAAPQQLECDIVCNYPTTVNVTKGVTIIANVTGNLLVVANVTANIFLVIDFNAGLIGLFDGNTGEAVIIDITKKEGVYFSAKIWLVANISLEGYVRNLKSLNSFLQITGSISFTVSSASETILKCINGMVGLLILNITLELQLNLKLGLEIIISICSTVITLIKGGLKGFLGLIGTEVILTRFDLVQFVYFLQSFALILTKILFTLADLIAKGVIFNLRGILEAASGVEILSRIITAIIVKVDIGAALVFLLDIEIFFNIIAQLGGRSFVGINGLFYVIATLVAFAKGHVRIEILIAVLIQFLAYNDISIRKSLFVVLQGILSLILNIFKQFGLEQTLAGLISVINDLINGKLVVNKVPISLIIGLLLGGSTSSGLVILVRVLILLEEIVAVAVSIPLLLVILIIFLKISIGVNLLIGIGIGLEKGIEKSGNIIADVLKLIPNLITLLLKGVYDLLLTLSVFGVLVKAVEAAVTEASSGKLVLKTLCNGSTNFVALIKAIFVFIGGIIIIGVVTTEIKLLVDIVVNTVFGFQISVSGSIGGNVTISS